MGSSSRQIGSLAGLAALGAAVGFVAGLLRRRPRTPYPRPAPPPDHQVAGHAADVGEG